MAAQPISVPDEGIRSHPGRVRQLNEDSYGTFRTVLDSLQAANRDELLRRKGRLYVIADGMGGHEHGEIASATAVQQICATYYAVPDDNPADGLRLAITQANAAIYTQTQAHQRPGARPMGTTVVCAVIHGAHLTLGHVGDSRAYRLRGGQLEQLTDDHDWITEQMQLHGWSREEAQRRARQRGTRGTLLRAVGVQPSVQPDIATYDWRPDDVLLLSTDGLHGLVSAAEIARVLAAHPAPRAAHELIAAANAAGGHDNSTALVIHAGGSAAASTPRPGWHKLARTLAISVAALLLLFGWTARATTSQPIVVPNSMLELAGLPTLAPTVALLPTATPSATPSATATSTPTPTPTPTNTRRPTARPATAQPTRPRSTAPALAPSVVTPTASPSPEPPTEVPASPTPEPSPSLPADPAPPAPPTATFVLPIDPPVWIPTVATLDG